VHLIYSDTGVRTFGVPAELVQVQEPLVHLIYCDTGARTFGAPDGLLQVQGPLVHSDVN